MLALPLVGACCCLQCRSIVCYPDDLHFHLPRGYCHRPAGWRTIDVVGYFVGWLPRVAKFALRVHTSPIKPAPHVQW